MTKELQHGGMRNEPNAGHTEEAMKMNPRNAQGARPEHIMAWFE